VCFLNIDTNTVELMATAAEFFWPKMLSGAAMLQDDYGDVLHIVQKR
jgi:hypothetical protein